MAERVKGGRRIRIGGLTMSDSERRLVDRARRRGKKKFSRAEYIRDAAIDRAHRDLEAPVVAEDAVERVSATG